MVLLPLKARCRKHYVKFMESELMLILIARIHLKGNRRKTRKISQARFVQILQNLVFAPR